MTNETKRIVEKAWTFAHVLREEGLSYLAYIEQITFLLFLKMADEVSSRHPRRSPLVPEGFGWRSLAAKSGTDLRDHYEGVLELLSRQPGMLGEIFRKPRPEIQNPRTLRHLIVDLIGSETWTEKDADVVGDIYEGLLARTASESPRGAGQYFTPRGLISAVVDCVRPTMKDTVCDPAAGTGGFLVAAHRFVNAQKTHSLSREERHHLKESFAHGFELVPNTARLCMMNMYLRGMESVPSPIEGGCDALAIPPSRRFSVVLTNPPFGTKGSLGRGIDKGDGSEPAELRRDFWVSTSNKQLAFIQHAYTLMRKGGRCAIVVPDNVLFEGGAGEVVRRNLLEKCRVHTLLRLPPGIFYAQSVKANVLFFDRVADGAKYGLWVYDLRAHKRFTLRNKQIARPDFDDFVKCFRADDIGKRRATFNEKNRQGRWRCFAYRELKTRDRLNLDLSWLKEEERRSTETALPPPRDLANRITRELGSALQQFQRIAERLGKG